MRRAIEQPVTVEGDRDETITTHPAFAQIRANRVSGYANLYGSDFGHHNYIEITVCHSELRRGLSRDWHFGRREIVSVQLSEAQWATFVSAMNQGSGVPCTLDHIDQRAVPALPDPESRVDQFQGEVKKDLDAVIELANKLIAEIDDVGLSKVKAEKLRLRAEAIKRELGCNLPFVARSFSEHMERTVEDAKIEIHGYMTSVIQRAGLDAITNGHLPLRIEHKEE